MLMAMQITALRPNSSPPPRICRLRDAASDDLLAQAAALRREANEMQAEYNELAPPPPPEPEPKPKPSEVAGVSPSEVLEWTGSAFAGTVELSQEDGATRRTPAEWSPWYGAGKLLAFQRELSLPLGIILEEGWGGSIRVAEVRPGGSSEQRDIRPGDVLRACSAMTKQIVLGNALLPESTANTKLKKSLAPCDMQPIGTVMDNIISNEGTILLVFERELVLINLKLLTVMEAIMPNEGSVLPVLERGDSYKSLLTKARPFLGATKGLGLHPKAREEVVVGIIRRGGGGER
jgi:hypothetical protein